MNVFDILLLSVALSADAAAAGMSDGMAEPKMSVKKSAWISGAFGAFQAAMPLIGYFLAHLAAGAFLGTFKKFSALLASALLFALGGKMIFDGVKEMRARRMARNFSNADIKTDIIAAASVTRGKVLLQATATSIDALAAGVAMKMAAISPEGLFSSAGVAAAIIGCVTFCIGFIAVRLGRRIGDKLADKAEMTGGGVLVALALKLLVEGLLKG